jgi:ABC-2 type transport system ATP-binding protein
MLLQTEDLTKTYGRLRALDRLTLRVAPGEIFGLLGPNGSGKSTALRLLLGFLRPSAGTARIAGHDCWRDSVAARRNVAYLPGELRLYENMTGWRLLHFLGQLRGIREFAEVDRLAQTLDIDLSRPIAQLSSGMKRKVALLLVLAPRTPLLLLDEPTNTLDPTMRDELLAQLRAARDRGQAVLFSSHVLGEVERVCDRVGILHRGRLVHVQEMSELQEKRLVKVRFDRPVWPVPALPGLHRSEGDGPEVTLEYDGPLPALLEWLAGETVLDLTITPIGLGPIYHRYHGGEG